jgi:predicted dehydrogenase
VTPNLASPKNAYKRSYEIEIRHFLECVGTGQRCDSPGEDALTLLRTLEAIYQSALESREVRLS